MHRYESTRTAIGASSAAVDARLRAFAIIIGPLP